MGAYERLGRAKDRGDWLAANPNWASNPNNPVNREYTPGYQTQKKIVPLLGGLPKLPAAPGPAPDLTDEVVQAAARSERMKTRIGQNRRSTFLTGAMGDSSAPNLGRKSLLGG